MLKQEWVLVRAVSLRKNDEFDIRKHEQSRNTALLTPPKTQKIDALKELNFLLLSLYAKKHPFTQKTLTLVHL